MKITLHDRAEHDLQEAAVFYEREGTPALAARFVAEFKRVVAMLDTHPRIGSPRSKDRRGFSMNTFPYTVIYRLKTDEIFVLVIKHDRKHPGFGSQRS
jgi:toxin ParE1/3/4